MMTDDNPEELTLGPGASLDSRPLHRQRTEEESTALRHFTVDAARLLRERHFENVLVIDVQGLSDITDYVLLASGTSDRQIKSVADEVEDLAEQAHLERYGREGDAPMNWVVIDFIDVVVHLFEPATRAHYDLEMLWGDAPRVDWQGE